jgi:hypothetical protein
VVDDLAAGFTFKYTFVMFKKVQRAVNGRLVNPWQAFVNMPDYFLGRQMAVFVVYVVQNHPAGLSEPETLFFQCSKTTHSYRT